MISARWWVPLCRRERSQKSTAGSARPRTRGCFWRKGATPPSAGKLTSTELHALAKRLSAKGKVQTAFLCGKRAVELKPDDWTAWYDLGEIAQCVGRRDEARAAYQRYFDAHPEDAEIEHLLMALRDDTPPPRTSDRAIQHIYKSFSKSYESRMLEDLKYVGPERNRGSRWICTGGPGRPFDSRSPVAARDWQASS